MFSGQIDKQLNFVFRPLIESSSISTVEYVQTTKMRKGYLLIITKHRTEF